MQFLRRLRAISSLRWTRLMFGLFAFGMGTAFMKRAHLGLAPWEVLNDGVSYHTGMLLGTASIAVAAVVLLLWIPMKMKPGIGTIFNMVLVGAFTNLGLLFFGTIENLFVRSGVMAIGIGLVGLGSAFYLGSQLGAGPRDGLMVGLHDRTGWPLSRTRTIVEIVVLGAGYLLHGTVGPATVIFAFSIGPVIQWTMTRLKLRLHSTEVHEAT